MDLLGVLGHGTDPGSIPSIIWKSQRERDANGEKTKK
jgi:hypothetical protein